MKFFYSGDFSIGTIDHIVASVADDLVVVKRRGTAVCRQDGTRRALYAEESGKVSLADTERFASEVATADETVVPMMWIEVATRSHLDGQGYYGRALTRPERRALAAAIPPQFVPEAA